MASCVNLLLLLMGIACVLALVAAVRNVVAQGEGMYTDAILLIASLRVRDGLPLYPDVTKPPFLFLHYGPLYPLLSGFIARATSLGMAETLVVLRALTVLSMLVAAGSVAGLARLCGADRIGALVAGGFFVTSYVIHPWAYVARTDLPAAALVFSGMLVLLRFPTMTGAVAGGVLMGTGFECKQTYVVGVAVATLALLWQRQWVRAAGLAGAWLAVVGGTVLLMNGMSEHRFLEQTIGNNVIPFRPETLWGHLALYLPQSASLLTLAAVGAYGAWQVGPTVGTVRVYTVFAMAVGMVAITRMGSNYNYFVEGTALLAVFAGIGLSRIRSFVERCQAGPAVPGSLASVLAVSLMMAVLAGFSLPLHTMWFAASLPPDRTGLIEVIRQQPGLVLTERDALAVMLAGKQPIGGDPIGVSSIALDGRWDPAPLNEMVRAQQFSLVVLRTPIETAPHYYGFPWWPPGTHELIQEQYSFDRRLGNLYLYVPNLAAPDHVSVGSTTPSSGERLAAEPATP